MLWNSLALKRMISVIVKNALFADHFTVLSTIISNLYLRMIFAKDWALKKVFIIFQNFFDVLSYLKRDLFWSLTKGVILVGFAESALDLPLNDYIGILWILVFHHFSLNALFARSFTTANHRNGHSLFQIEPQAACWAAHVRSATLLLFLHIDN